MPKPRRVRAVAPSAPQPELEADRIASLNALVDESVRLVHRLKSVAHQLHGQGKLAASRRGILRGLRSSGPQSVPQMARARPVSRQHIQGLINQLLEDRLVELIDNPAHRRSKLVQLAPKGDALVCRMLEREARLFRSLPLALSSKQLDHAVEALIAVRGLLESRQCAELIAHERDRGRGKGK
jgi:DNA-binding MarR family transcriptional regulator